MGDPRGTMSTLFVRPYNAGKHEESNTDCITEAFRADPIMSKVMMPTEKEYASTMPFVTKTMVWALNKSYGMTDVGLDKDGNVLCSALWEPAGMTFMGGLRFVYLLGAMFLRVGFVKTIRTGKFLFAMEDKRHRHAPTAHHLQILGTHPNGQSKGFGSQVIKRGIERATSKGVPCYLESTNPQNVPFYKRHGFRVVEEYYHWEKEDAVDGDGSIVEGRGPVLTLMIRDIPKSEGGKKLK